MSLFRFAIGLLVVSALVCTATGGWCAEQDQLDQQIAERTKQYQESLRQRAQQLSPSLQEKIESQARQTVAKGLKLWNNGELAPQIALPRWAEARRAAQFVARHLPHLPTDSLLKGAGDCVAAITAVR